MIFIAMLLLLFLLLPTAQSVEVRRTALFKLHVRERRPEGYPSGFP